MKQQIENNMENMERKRKKEKERGKKEEHYYSLKAYVGVLGGVLGL